MTHRAKDIDNGATDRAFAASRLSDKPESFPTLEGERHAIDSAHFADFSGEDTPRNREPDPQILDFKQLHFSTNTHRTQWPGETSIKSGSYVKHFSRRSGQRVTNLQPAGRSRMLGTLPGMVFNRVCLAPSTAGNDASRPFV